MRSLARFKGALRDWLVTLAQWRREKAEAFPEDSRVNLDHADLLRTLSRYIATLPDVDPRLLALRALDTAFARKPELGTSADHYLRSDLFHLAPTADPDRLLDGLLQAAQEDAELSMFDDATPEEANRHG